MAHCATVDKEDCVDLLKSDCGVSGRQRAWVWFPLMLSLCGQEFPRHWLMTRAEPFGGGGTITKLSEFWHVTVGMKTPRREWSRRSQDGQAVLMSQGIMSTWDKHRQEASQTGCVLISCPGMLSSLAASLPGLVSLRTMCQNPFFKPVCVSHQTTTIAHKKSALLYLFIVLETQKKVTQKNRTW